MEPIQTITIWILIKDVVNSPFYELLKDVITAVVSVGVFVVAWKGLKTWKEQITGVKAYEIAYNLHYSILKLRDAVRHVRNPGIWPSESRQAIQYARAKYPEKSPEKIEEDSRPYVYEMRWEEIKVASTEVESHLLGVEVLWGSEICELIKPLNTKITELNIALSQKFNSDLQTKSAMELFNIVYGGVKPDNFSKDINTAVQNITNYIGGKLS